MIMPMPYYNKSALVVVEGTVDITVGEGGPRFGYFPGEGFGSKSNDTLLSVDGEIGNVNKFYSGGGEDQLEVLFSSIAYATAALDYVQANFTLLSCTGWQLSTSNMIVDGTGITGQNSPANWDAGDVGNTYTSGWS